MSRQYWSETIAWATADGTAVNTTTTETIIFPNVTIPANMMQDGRALRITARGRWSTSGANSLTWTIRMGGVGGVTCCVTPAAVMATNTNAQWVLNAILQVRTNGSAGTLFAQMDITAGTGTLPTMGTVTQYGMSIMGGSAGIATPAASAAIDFTADQALSITIKPGTSNASDGVTGHIYILEALN